MGNKPLDFQTATADHVLETFKSGRRRVLVADEAGLGKTTVAAEVVKRVKQELAGEVLRDDGLYFIVYVCCNMQIAQQNIDTLCNEGNNVDLSQSRLSMQHYVYYRKKAELARQGKDTLVLSLTPATSFKMTWGTGNVHERALIYATLSLLPEFGDEERLAKLSQLLVCSAVNSWSAISRTYYEQIRIPELEEYRTKITDAISTRLAVRSDIRWHLAELCEPSTMQLPHNDAASLIIDLRRMFADISLDFMNPDLVIMDEFQKFSFLINESQTDTDTHMIARKFLSEGSAYILLLSATPYKPCTTIEEINRYNSDDQYKDFHLLMKFLHANERDSRKFKTIWNDYSCALTHPEQETDTSIIDKHDAAENMLYRVMGRTERVNSGIIDPRIQLLDSHISADDIISYIQMHNLIESCRKSGVRVYSAPVDYTKSTAYQLSFMDNYTLKNNISEAWNTVRPDRTVTDRLLLDGEAIENYSLKDYRNARLKFMVDAIFGGKNSGIETLLWIPPSHPYYTQPANVFTRNASFSKFLIFSAWGMVPKMLACMISYETERRLYRHTGYTYHKDDYQLLKDDKKTRSLSVIQTVSAYLADLYDPGQCFGLPLSIIKKQIKAAVKEKLDSFTTERVSRVSSMDIYQLLLAFDNPDVEIRNIPREAADILTEIAIGSPAMCLYRTFRRIGDNDAIAHATAVATEMTRTLFNNRMGIRSVRRNCRKYGNYFRNVIDYCIQGNLQSMIDEFVHMIGEHKCPSDIVTRINMSFTQSYPQPVNSIQTFGSEAKFSMHKHFAIDFGTNQQSEDDVARSVNVRTAFNSPFRPFVLASTSIGQEGLDFHWYCRKITHWNLPSNPQNLEQREGRVNRYKCLSVRRNISKLYNDIYGWNDMFAKAANELKGDNSEMVPYWYLPLNDGRFKSIETEQIERIVPLYPLSEEANRYRRLINELSLYRLTMGQPRQEELMQMLEGKFSTELIERLLFDLSPFSRMKQSGRFSRKQSR